MTHAMESKLFWLGSALGGALFVMGCSNGGGSDGGTTTGATGSSTAAVTGTGSSTGGVGTSTGGVSSTGGVGTSTGAGTTTTGGSTGSVDAGVGTPCDATVTDTTCAPFGLFCQGTLISDGGFPATCVLPIDQVPCLPEVGCAPSFFCVAGVFSNTHNCVQGCQSSTDCGNLIENCVPTVIAPDDAGCVLNACGPGSNPPNGTGFYSPCSVDQGGASDSTCLPFSTSQAFCSAGGIVPLNQPCIESRVDGGGDVCVQGTTCVALNVSNHQGVFYTASACLAPCPAAAPFWSDGGPGCAGNSTCEAVFNGLSFGACFQNCVLANPNCPSPLVCLNIGNPTNGICGPG
jgi:hypothetical protein